MSFVHLLFISCVIVSTFAGAAFAQSTEGPNDIRIAIKSSLKAHPRLFLIGGQEKSLNDKVAHDPELSVVYRFLQQRADELLAKPSVERRMEGRRLLAVSREALERISTLTLVFRLTGDGRYADRARTELLAAASFTDWNPQHFLDSAEMSAALAIGYDWLFDRLSSDDRKVIRTALVEKAIKPSYGPGQRWLGSTNNWVQVCHGGLTLAALAIADEEPDVAAQVLQRAVQMVPDAVGQYSPAGIYPEGPGYWGYGTAYHAILVSALVSALGSDFGLSQDPSFVKTPHFFLHCTGPSGQWFNYCDCWNRSAYAPAMWWFAGCSQDASLLFSERRLLFSERRLLSAAIRQGQVAPDYEAARFIPLMLIWAPNYVSPVMPAATSFVGSGPTPLAIFRSSWADDATWVAIKGGSPTVSHGHMDVGAFVLDALGVRWAEDLGYQKYNTLESKNVDLWNMRPNSQRWSVFRISAAAHNILMVDGKNQNSEGKAAILRSSSNFAIIDLADIYQGQLSAAQRGAKLNADGSVRIQDEIVGGDSASRVRWAFVTSAEFSSSSASAAMLIRDGKKMQLRLSGQSANFQTYSAKGTQEFDAENPGKQLIGFEFDLQPRQRLSFAVDFVPGNQLNAVPSIMSLADW